MRAKGFKSTQTHPTAGLDKAFLFDSAADDVFTARPDYSEMLSVDGSYDDRVSNSQKVYGFSTKGGGDVANLYDSDVYADVLTAGLSGSDSNHWAEIAAAASSPLDYLYYIRGFKEAHVPHRDPATDNADGVDAATADWLLGTDP